MADAEDRRTEEDAEATTGERVGLTYAPPYDPSQEIDPRAAPVVESKDVLSKGDFEYFRQQMERTSMYGRIGVVLVVFVLLLANIWLTRQSTTDIVWNIDQARLHQSEFEDGVQRQLIAMERKLGEIEEQNEALVRRLEGRGESLDPVAKAPR